MLNAAVHSTTDPQRQLLNVHLTAAASITANPPDYLSVAWVIGLQHRSRCP